MLKNFDKVLEFATEKHIGQMRRDGSPYIVHPVRVSHIITEYSKDSENLNTLVAAALLHDTIEDTNTSFKELQENFGSEVASMVMELSTAPFAEKTIGNAEYLCRHMEFMSSNALTVKLADRLDNLKDLFRFPKTKVNEKIYETQKAIARIKHSRKLNNVQLQLCSDIKKILQDCKTYMNLK